jgi:hypothetical protein
MSKKSPRDQRRTFRCAVTDARQSCQLKVGSQVFSATLQDESAGGFSVLVDRSTGLQIDQTAELHVNAGWFEIKVVHVMEALPPEGANLAEQGPWFRLGLRRLGEVSLPNPPRISLFATSLYFHLSQWCPSGGILLVFGLLLAMTVVLVPLAVTGAHWHAAHDLTNQILKLPFSDSPRNVHLAEPESNSEPAGEVQRDSAAEFEQALKNAVGHAPDVALLAVPYAVRKLQLTNAQQQELRKLVEATAQALRDLDAQLKSEKRPEISQLRTQVTDGAYRTALELLTDQQRAQWKKMTAKQ